MEIKVEGLSAGYGLASVLHDVDIEVRTGEAVAIIGPNGAGKTTLMKSIVGMLRPTHGCVSGDKQSLTGLRTFQVVRRGVVYVPAERELFPTMSVFENLELGAYCNAAAQTARMRYVFGLFPRLQERKTQLASTLSGGEQQMLAIGRALMTDPKVLLLDEPSTGLAPRPVAELYEQLSKLKAAGLTIIVAEQQVPLVLQLTDRAYVLEQGAVRLSGCSSGLLSDPMIKKAYLGVT